MTLLTTAGRIAIIGLAMIGALYLLGLDPKGVIGDLSSGSNVELNTEPPDATVAPPTPTESPTTQTKESPVNKEQLANEIHIEINKIRDDHALSRLAFDGKLSEIAASHSKDMASKGYFAHEAPDGDTLRDRYRDQGYNCRVETGGNRYTTGGENLARFTISAMDAEKRLAERIVAGWMDSERHRENILRPFWQREGIGIAVGEADGRTWVYVTQNFC